MTTTVRVVLSMSALALITGAIFYCFEPGDERSKQAERLLVEITKAMHHWDIEEMERKLEDLLAIIPSLESPKREYYTIIYHYNMGIVENFKKNFKEAKRHFEKIIKICSEENWCVGKYKGCIGMALFGLADIEDSLGNTQNALEIFKSAAENFLDKSCCCPKWVEDMGWKNYCAHGASVTLGRIGDIYYERGEFSEALSAYINSLNVLEPMIPLMGKRVKVTPLLKLGRLFKKMGEIEKSVNYLCEAKRIINVEKRVNPQSKWVKGMEEWIIKLLENAECSE